MRESVHVKSDIKFFDMNKNETYKRTTKVTQVVCLQAG